MQSGPPYRVPTAPMPAAAQFKEGTWKVATPSDAIPRGAWWTMFGEPELDELEVRLNINNQTIAQAFQNYLAARAQIRIARSQYVPTVTAGPAASWYRTSSNFAGSTTTTGVTTTQPTPGSGQRVAPGTRITSYALPLEVSWAPDLFGRVKYAVRQSQYGAQMSAADLESTRLLAQATLAQTYFQLRGQDALVEVLEGVVKSYEEILALTAIAVREGLDSEVNVRECRADPRGRARAAHQREHPARTVRARDRHAHRCAGDVVLDTASARCSRSRRRFRPARRRSSSSGAPTSRPRNGRWRAPMPRSGSATLRTFR